MKVYEADYDDIEMYVSDFKIGAPGYVWMDGEGWCEVKVTYVKSYNINNEPENLPHKGNFSGEFITDDGCYWICMDFVKEVSNDEVDIEVIRYC